MKKNAYFVLVGLFVILALGLTGCGGGGGGGVVGTSYTPTTTYTFVASAGVGGTIDPSGTALLSQGASYSYKITAKAGYRIQDVFVDGASVGAVSNYYFNNISDNHTITATFTQIYNTIFASVDNCGDIYPSGTTILTSDDNQVAYTIAACDNRFSKLDVLVDGVSVGAVPNYTFSNVIGGHTITASFALSPNTVKLTASKNVALNNDSDSVNLTATVSPAVPNGSVVSFTAPPGTTISNVTTTSGSVATAVARSITHGSVPITASYLTTGKESAIVKFMPQPASARVRISLKKAVDAVQRLTFRLDNESGSVFSSSTLLNEVSGSINLIAPAVDSSNVVIPNVYDVGFIGFYLGMFPVTTPVNIIANNVLFQLNYSIIPGSVIPKFVIDSYPASALDKDGINLGVINADILVYVTYLDSLNNPL